jgi:hypothetical protein
LAVRGFHRFQGCIDPLPVFLGGARRSECGSGSTCGRPLTKTGSGVSAHTDRGMVNSVTRSVLFSITASRFGFVVGAQQTGAFNQLSLLRTTLQFLTVSRNKPLSTDCSNI